MSSSEFCEISKNSLFTEHLRTLLLCFMAFSDWELLPQRLRNICRWKIDCGKHYCSSKYFIKFPRIIIIISFFKVDFHITFYNYKKSNNVKKRTPSGKGKTIAKLKKSVTIKFLRLCCNLGSWNCFLIIPCFSNRY